MYKAISVVCNIIMILLVIFFVVGFVLWLTASYETGRDKATICMLAAAAISFIMLEVLKWADRKIKLQAAPIVISHHLELDTNSKVKGSGLQVKYSDGREARVYSEVDDLCEMFPIGSKYYMS